MSLSVLQNSLSNVHIHFDQFMFTARVNHDILHDALADTFGKGKRVRKEFSGLNQWGVMYFEAGIFASRYMNKHGWCWLSLPATYEHLTDLGLFAANNSIPFRLHSAELAFDFPFPQASYYEVETMLRSLVHRLSIINGRGIRVVRKSGGEFQQCADNTINGKTTFYFHPLNKAVLKDTGNKRPGKYISAKTKAYAKEICGVWNIRVEVTMKKSKLKCNLPFLPHEYERLTKLCNNDFNFSDFFELKSIDYSAFRARVLSMAKKKAMLEGKTSIDPILIIMLNEAAALPFHEQKHNMVKIAKRVGSRRLADNLKQFESALTLHEALSMPLPDEI
jgi:hypothetical protein